MGRMFVPILITIISIALTIIIMVAVGMMLGIFFPPKAVNSAKAMQYALNKVYAQETGTKSFGDILVECDKGEDYVGEELGANADDYVGCRITNFELPQAVDIPWEDRWIPGKGDPKYVLYFEEFPQSDSYAWSQWIGLDIALTFIPVGKLIDIGSLAVKGVVKPVAKIGKMVFKVVTKTGEVAMPFKFAKVVFVGAKNIISKVRDAPTRELVGKLEGKFAGKET
ncbi:MAG: hypothetical protein DRP11_01325, partial [Candidatus Aenigmatarchaeota archaeon]